MATTVLGALKNAKSNLDALSDTRLTSLGLLNLTIACDQLYNAIAALQNGLNPDDVIQEHMLGPVNTGE